MYMNAGCSLLLPSPWGVGLVDGGGGMKEDEGVGVLGPET